MQRIVNNPNLVVEDMLEGFLKVHSNLVHVSATNERVIVSNSVKKYAKVGIVTGGGSGHKPAFVGYCGRNMVDAVAVGEVFSSPTAKSFYDAIKEADQGKGVAILYGNYAGDNMNVKIAMDYAREDNIHVMKLVANDDVASASGSEKEKRRGVAGEIFMWKVAGAKASTGASLESVIKTTEKAINNTRSVGVGLAPCTIPAVGKPNFMIENGTMEFGIGHHGEPGVKIEKLGTAKEIAFEMVEMILNEDLLKSQDDAAIILSGLGATPIMEQYIVFNEVEKLLNKNSINIYRSYVGNYFTSLDMNGVTLSIMKLDDELKECIDLEVETMGLTQFGRV